MDIESKTWLYNILQSINEIESFLAGMPQDFADYQKDIRTKRAVERNIEIIGEAMNRILHKDSAIRISNAKQIVNTRNRIIHGYDTVSDAMIWSIVVKYIPVLKTEVQDLLHSQL